MQNFAPGSLYGGGMGGYGLPPIGNPTMGQYTGYGGVAEVNKLVQLLQRAGEIFQQLLSGETGTTVYPNENTSLGPNGFGNQRTSGTLSDWKAPIGPNTVRGTAKWSGGNGIDLFARAGEPIYAMFAGTVVPNSSNPGPGGMIVPALTLQGDNGISADYVHVKGTKLGRVNAGDIIGYVGDPPLSILGAYPGMPDNFQHLDLRVGHGRGGFSVQGGDINVNTVLRQLGYRGQQLNAQTRGPNMQIGGVPPAGGMSLLSYGRAPTENSGYGPLLGGTPTMPPTGNDYGEEFDAAAQMVAEVSATIVQLPETLQEMVAAPEGSGLELVAKELGPTATFESPFKEANWGNILKYLIAALILSAFVSTLEGFNREWAYGLTILTLGALFVIPMAEGGPNRLKEFVDILSELMHGTLTTVNHPASWQSGLGGPNTSPRGVTTTSSVTNAAMSQLGKPYVWGGASPLGFDCSGLVQWAFGQIGVSLPRTSQEQYQTGTEVARGALQPGDVVFFRDTNGPGITHNGIYLGNDVFINAPRENENVQTANLNSAYWAQHYAGARRYR